MAIIGIEICPDALRAVCFERYKAGRQPLRAVEVPLAHPLGLLETAGDGALAEPIKKLTEELDMAKAVVAVAVPSSWCNYRNVFFPYRSSSRVEKTFRYALEDRLPGAIEDYVIEPIANIRQSGSDGSRLSVAACSAKRVSTLLAEFRSAGIEPCIVQPAAVSVAQAVQATASISPDESALVVRVETTGCEIAWVSGCDVLACRSIRLVNPGAHGAADADAIAEKVRLAVRMNEVSDGALGFRRVIVLASEEKVAEAVATSLEQYFDVPVQALPSDFALNSAYAAACGVAAEAATRKHAAPNLRRGENAYRPYARRLEYRAAAALLLAIGITCMLGAYTMRVLLDAKKSLSLIRDQQAGLSVELGCVGKPTLHKMESVLAETEKAARQARRNEIASCLVPWQELMKLAPGSSQMRCHLIDINQSQVSIKAVVQNDGVVTRFVKRLSDSPVFLPDPLHDIKRTGSGERSLSMELRYK